MISPRPVIGEPLALDLVNTQWGTGKRYHDFFDDLEGVAQWLDEVGIARGTATLEDIRMALLPVRQALKKLLSNPSDIEARSVLNGVLERGSIVTTLGKLEVEERIMVADVSRAAWLAARDYLKLLTSSPERVRKCANAKCVRYFLDTTRNHSRQWCSMQLCGAREKAKRQYQKQKQAASTLIQ